MFRMARDVGPADQVEAPPTAPNGNEASREPADRTTVASPGSVVNLFVERPALAAARQP